MTFLLGINTAYANKTEDLTNKKEQVQKQINGANSSSEELENLLNEVTQKIKEDQTKLDALNIEIEQNKKELEKLNSQIQEKQKNIAVLTEELEIEKAKLEKNKEILEKTFRLIYSKGKVGMVEFLFQSKDLSDFLYRIENLKKINQQIDVLYEQTRKEKEEIELKKKEVEKEKEELTQQQNIINLKISDLQIKTDEQKNLIEKTEAQKQVLYSKLKEQKEVIEQLIHERIELEQQIEQEKQMAQHPPKDNLPGGKSDITGNNVVELAYKWVQQRGLGSSNPVIYSMPKRQLSLQTYGDCSSFTYRVFKDAGYGEIGYNTSQQISNPRGQFIERVADLQPGDLMYFGPTGDHRLGARLPDGRYVQTAHTAIYVGNNTMIDLSYSVGTISVKHFGSGEKWNHYVMNSWVGGKRFFK